MNIYQKLVEARVDLQNLKLKKSGHNQNFTYYELGDFLPAINELGKKYGFMTQFSIEKDEYGESATLSIRNIENVPDSPQKVIFMCPTAEVKLPKGQEIQNMGSKITYMRRYMLMTAFEMVESDMIDAIKRDLSGDLEDDEVEEIASAKDFDELTAVCSRLKKTYKVAVIKPLYEKRKAELEENTRKAE